LRGWLHTVAAPVSGLAGVPLVVAAVHHRVPLLVYTASLVVMFTTSAGYHRGSWSAAGRRWWRRLDHCTIFVFIAGSYTAYSAVALPAAQATRCWSWSGWALLPALGFSCCGRRHRVGWGC